MLYIYDVGEGPLRRRARRLRRDHGPREDIARQGSAARGEGRLSAVLVDPDRSVTLTYAAPNGRPLEVPLDCEFLPVPVGEDEDDRSG